MVLVGMQNMGRIWYYWSQHGKLYWPAWSVLVSVLLPGREQIISNGQHNYA